METKKRQKNAENYFCEKCDFTCSKASEWNRHKMTAKHKMETKETKKTPKNAKPFMCSCGKVYKNRTGLWKHRQKCAKIEEFEKNEKNEKNEKTCRFLNIFWFGPGQAMALVRKCKRKPWLDLARPWLW